MIYLLITALLFISQYIVQPTHSQEPEPPPLSENLRLEEYACEADSPATFKACLAEAELTGVPYIKITAPIICESAAECAFTFKDSKKYLTIAPSKPENKIVRRGDFSYTLLNVEDSSNIEFDGVSFQDETTTGCAAATNCPPFMILNKVSGIRLTKVSFLNTAGISLAILNPRELIITNSDFKNSFKSAIDIKTANFTEMIKIDRNLFQGNAGSGISFQAMSIGEGSTINFNTFTDNHSKGSYSNCIYPCTGAQIDIQGPTTNLRVAQNTITGGANSTFDSLGLYASGVAISGQNVNNTSLFCNEITGNRGSGIVQGGPFANISNITISENKVSGNGINLNIPSFEADDQNCYNKECELSCKQTP